MKTADVSVIIPYFNSGPSVVRAIRSVLEQTLVPEELLVVDDASLDNSHEVVDLYLKGLPSSLIVKHIRNSNNKGAGASRNVGIENSTKSFLAFLDSDDVWHRQKIETVMREFSNDESLFLVAHKYSFVPPKENFLQVSTRYIMPEDLLYRNHFSTPAVCFKRNPKYLFPERSHSEDFSLWLDILFSGNKAVKIESPFSWRQPEVAHRGLSTQLLKMELGELKAFNELYRSGKISYFVCFKASLFSILKFFLRLITVPLGKFKR